MAGSMIGRAGQAFTGLGSWGRAQGAQSRFDPLPQTGTMARQAGRGAAAGKEEEQARWKMWLDQQKRGERMRFFAGFAKLMKEGALSISDAASRRKVNEALEEQVTPIFRPQTEVPFAPTTIPTGGTYEGVGPRGRPATMPRGFGAGFGFNLSLGGPEEQARGWRDDLALMGRY